MPIYGKRYITYHMQGCSVAVISLVDIYPSRNPGLQAMNIFVCCSAENTNDILHFLVSVVIMGM